jgi:hypothetical protein
LSPKLDHLVGRCH